MTCPRFERASALAALHVESPSPLTAMAIYLELTVNESDDDAVRALLAETEATALAKTAAAAAAAGGAKTPSISPAAPLQSAPPDVAAEAAKGTDPAP